MSNVKDGIDEKMDILRKKFPKDIDILNASENKLRELISKSSFTKQDIVIEIMKDAEDRINTINTLLANDEKMSQEERLKLFAEKSVWKFVFDRFGMKDVFNKIRYINFSIDQKIGD